MEKYKWLYPLRAPTLYWSFFTHGLILLAHHFSLNSAQKLNEKALKDLEQKMEKQEIKEVLQRPPKNLIELQWDHGQYIVKAGDKVNISKVHEKPTSVIWDAEPEHFYTLVLYDYDAPVRAEPQLRSFIHWMIGNIPGKNWTAGTTIYDYFGLKLFKKKDVHRYMTVIYKQSGKITRYAEPVVNNEMNSFFPELVSRNDTKMSDALRPLFNRTEFEEKYKLGAPYAFFFFTSELGDS
ncbi:protein D3-like isoform X2 [Bemisia tabaci]